MSEFQIVLFRAIDRPLTDKQVEFMDRQSSRAELTKWEFKVEYHYSSFRGDVDGMLRNGYDIFLNYSNYESREIRMRLPNGLPFAKNVVNVLRRAKKQVRNFVGSWIAKITRHQYLRPFNAPFQKNIHSPSN